jgi:protein gp37
MYCETFPEVRGLAWVIAGGESGGPPDRSLVMRAYDAEGAWWQPKPEAREWVQAIRDQVKAAGVAFHFKQWGGPKPHSGGRMLDGRTWDEVPTRELEGALL